MTELKYLEATVINQFDVNNVIKNILFSKNSCYCHIIKFYFPMSYLKILKLIWCFTCVYETWSLTQRKDHRLLGVF